MFIEINIRGNNMLCSRRTMTIPFTEFYERVTKHTPVQSQNDLANALGIHRSAITQAKLRDAVPQKWILTLARRYSLSADWLEYGTEAPKAMSIVQRALSSVSASPEVILVPKVQAKVCAGAGSYEIEAVPVSEHPFPYQWLSRMGTPNSMVFMDVIGDSMEPSIRDGDMVLVDQSGKSLSPHSIFAVGVEDSIFIKRVEPRDGAVILHSDNRTYSDIELYEDELASFHVIGKVVWLCRDLR